MSVDEEIIVIGAGVIGLTTAVCIAEAGFPVRVRTTVPAQQTNSRVAGAMWGSSFAEPAASVKRWASLGLHEFRALAEKPQSGVRIASGMLASRRGSEPPPPDMFPGVQISPSSQPPDGFLGAFSVRLPLIDMPRYLDYLCGRLAEAGGVIEVRQVGDLAEAAEHAVTVVNCAGIAARELAHDPALQAVRGEHVVVENPGLEEFFMEEPIGREWTCFLPHGDRVVLGGTAGQDDWNLDPDPAGARGILERCAQIEPQLKDARVIEHQVGLRPFRPTIRVERESLGAATLIHNYGHGGSGVSLSWGCARDVTGWLFTETSRAAGCDAGFWGPLGG
jgi:D-amino-acid oxidase